MALSGPFRDVYTYYGLSTDDKPTELILEGSKFIEVDTGDEFVFLLSVWEEVGAEA